MLAKQIGGNIKAARKARGVSLEKLAAKIEPKTSYQQLSRLESGDRTLSVEWIERIAAAMEMDPLKLVVPERSTAEPQTVRLDEQVATEAAQVVATVALGDPDPSWGTVQAVALALRELVALFSKHPEAATDVRLARPALTLAGTRLAREGR